MLAPDSPKLLFFGYVLLTFALNWGVNVSTFVLPAMCFPAHIRSSFNGLSSAGGKIGAVIGSSSFNSVKDTLGFSGTYAVCTVISLLGVLVTVMFIPGSNSFTLDEPLAQALFPFGDYAKTKKTAHVVDDNNGDDWLMPPDTDNLLK